MTVIISMAITTPSRRCGTPAATAGGNGIRRFATNCSPGSGTTVRGVDSICPEYGTAMACIVLQMPTNYLPIFQRVAGSTMQRMVSSAITRHGLLIGLLLFVVTAPPLGTHAATVIPAAGAHFEGQLQSVTADGQATFLVDGAG